MDILILCLGALAATAVAWIYLNVQRPAQQPQAEEAAPETAPEQPDPFALPKRGRLVFLLVMLLGLGAMAAALETVYPSNTLLENGKLLTLLAILFVAANVDARQRIIPNALVLTGLVLRVVFWLLELLAAPNAFWGVFKNDMMACLLVVAFFVVGVLLVKGGIGMGDIKLMLVMCVFQGFYGVVSSLFCSLFAAFVYAIVVLLLRKKTKKDSVAFAPAILIGTALSVFLTGM